MTLRKRIAALALLLGAVAQSIQAVPAYPKKMTYKQPDGTLLEVQLLGDEHCHAYYTLDGQMLQPDERQMLRPVGKVDFGTYYVQHTKKAAAARKTISIDKDGRTTFPTVGKIKGVILLVEFADKSFTEGYDQALFDSLANDDNFAHDGATGSIAKYFKDQSYGQFQPEFDVVGPVKLSRKLSYYGQNDSYGQDYMAHYMITEAVQAADSLYDIDFSQYDNDKDGSVDFIYCIYAGYAESYGAPAYTVWPHQATLETMGAAFQLDGVTINRYACSSELKYTAGTTLEGIGTFCHEFGHVLGFPDMYQTNGGSGVPYGQWDTMDRGCYNNDSKTPAAYSAYERWCMKWMDLTDLEEPELNLQLPYIGDEPKAYRLVSPTNKDEYFILENRQQKGWDAPQAASGLMISHIDFMESSWNANIINNNSDHYRCAIVPADNEHGSSYSGDLFPGPKGKTSFTDESTPSSVLFDGTRLGKPVTAIACEDGIVSFSFMQSKLGQPSITSYELTDSSFTLHWDEVRNALGYKLTVNQVLADAEKPAPVSDDFSLMKEGAYTAALDEADLADSLDLYMAEAGWTGSNVYDAGGYAQVGKYGVGGSLVSPPMDLSANGGTFTVKYTVRAYPNRKMNYNFIVADSVGGAQLYKERFKQDGEPVVVYRVLHGGTAATVISFTTTNERLFVDEVKVARGEVDSVAMDSVANPSWTVEGITALSYTMDGLTPGATYSCYLQAMAGDELYDSKVSGPLTFTLPNTASGIRKVASGALGGMDVVEACNLAGQKMARGTVAELNAKLPRGLYIIYKGTRASKAILGK